MSFLLSKENARVIEQSDIETLTDRLEKIRDRNGNPMNVAIETFGNAVAFSVRNIPGPSFNTVKGITDAETDQLDSILKFYTAKELPARFEITPIRVSKELFRNLGNRGYVQSGFHSSLYGTLEGVAQTTEKELNTGISIEEMTRENFDRFGDIYTRGFGMPSFLSSGVTENNQVLLQSGRWAFYLARVEGEPAGVGVLFVKNGIATLAASATVPEYRNHGVQKALINQRIIKAMDSNCHLIVGQAAYGSVSQRNMERAGLKIAYTNSIWEKF
ncbi:hypothetical protein SAMN04487936_10555 [Halobacillus dabanensis]|uniref:N-acetyltransferase domain-containing protein n=1 Tax=Halobacillus dabanensis TaxID=240302 RepID=A0A1I3UY52_HALDA|nr:GNAT family N-acetyltransferase [Halobacillus dabanensis]SFJ88138.1 hypothetical protein SAMN04487936_10555 [Halobacillus dabanensis]